MRVLVLILAVLVPVGCGSVISSDVLKKVDRNVKIQEVQADPASLTGTMVLWGGVILTVENLEDATEIEVLEGRLSYDDTPEPGASRGRFIVRSPGFLDPEIYKETKQLTVAGTITGVEVRKIGKMDFAYPVLLPIEMKLSVPLSELDYLPWWNTPPYWGDPYVRPYSPYGPHQYYPTYPYTVPPHTH